MGNIIGLLKRRKKGVKIVIQGLDAAGKTTVLYRLKLGEVIPTIPTLGFNIETFEYKNVSFTAWDVSGKEQVRRLFRHYYRDAGALIFVIDSSDRERTEDVKVEMERLLGEDELRDCPFVILANKQDIPSAMKVHEIEQYLGLANISDTRVWKIFPTSGTTGEGLYEAFDWLTEKCLNTPSTKTTTCMWKRG